MAKVSITKGLEEEINRKFKGESVRVFELIYSLENNPKKGTPVGHVGGIAIKEVKYEKFRFYFVTDGFKVKFLQIPELENLLIKFVRMSDKKTQQKTIEEIKNILRNFGEGRL